jgi:hypothetical protein
MNRRFLNRRILAAIAVGVLIAGVVVIGSGSSQAAIDPAGSPTADSASVPAGLAVPAGQVLTSAFAGRGVQVYQCTSGAWVFVEPAATLDGRLTSAPWTQQSAVHFRGPSWESTADGSLVTGKLLTNSPVPGSIPELLLQATSNRGDGIFGKVSYIQRLRPTGGAAPAAPCTDGTTVAVPYTAKYRFYSPTS